MTLETFIEDVLVDDLDIIRLRLIAQNARLVDARKRKGFTASVVALATGIPRWRLRLIENLKLIPTDDEIMKLVLLLEQPWNYLFPQEIISIINTGVLTQRKRGVTAIEAQFLLRPPETCRLLFDGGLDEVEDKIDQDLLRNKFQDIFQMLTPQQQYVLEARFGLKDGHSRTLGEVGKEFGVTAERIRQIESKALRKIRKSRRARKILGYGAKKSGD